MALILEDDISLGPSLPVIVRGLLASSCQDWLVVRLDTKRDQVSKPMRTKFAGFKVAELADGAALYRLRTRVLGTGAYLIRREGAMKMLDYGKRIFMPIDQTMDRYWENGIVPYVVRPIPVFQADTFGSHSGERSNTRRRAQPFAVRQRRRLQRIEDAFRKRLFNVLHN
jgi:glycosyl transferase family 25